MTGLDLTDAYIDVSEITDRADELVGERDSEIEDDHTTDAVREAWAVANYEDACELRELQSLLDELRGNGGDHQWNGDWYPRTLIAEWQFNDAMDELLEDIGDIPRDLPCYLRIEVDYNALRMDYTSVEIGESTYLYR